VAHVPDGLLQVEGREVVADGEALIEGFVDGKTEGRAQGRMVDEQQGGEGLGVHTGGAEEAQLFDHWLGEQVGLVDDDQGSAALGDAEIVKGGADGADLPRGRVRRLVAEIEEQFTIEAGGAGGRVGEVDDQVAVGFERSGEGANSGSTQSPVDLPEPNSPVTRPKP